MSRAVLAVARSQRDGSLWRAAEGPAP